MGGTSEGEKEEPGSSKGRPGVARQTGLLLGTAERRAPRRAAPSGSIPLLLRCPAKQPGDATGRAFAAPRQGAPLPHPDAAADNTEKNLEEGAAACQEGPAAERSGSRWDKVGATSVACLPPLLEVLAARFSLPGPCALSKRLLRALSSSSSSSPPPPTPELLSLALPPIKRAPRWKPRVGCPVHWLEEFRKHALPSLPSAPNLQKRKIAAGAWLGFNWTEWTGLSQTDTPDPHPTPPPKHDPPSDLLLIFMHRFQNDSGIMTGKGYCGPL